MTHEGLAGGPRGDMPGRAGAPSAHRPGVGRIAIVWLCRGVAAGGGFCDSLHTRGPPRSGALHLFYVLTFLAMQLARPLLLNPRCFRSYRTGSFLRLPGRMTEAPCVNLVELLSMLGKMESEGVGKGGDRTERQ